MGHLQHYKGGVKIAFIKALKQALEFSFATEEITVKLDSKPNTYFCLAQKNSGFPRITAAVSIRGKITTVKFAKIEPQRGRFKDPPPDVQIEDA